MKRILSIFLCVAMLMSMAAMTVSADPIDDFPKAAGVTTSNKMVFTPNAESYAPGDEIIITASMESIWGDPTIVGDITGYEGLELPGAYGMATLVATLIFPLDTFTPKAGLDLMDDSTINNAEYTSDITKTALSDARNGGFYNFQISSGEFDDEEENYVFFTGSGDLFNYRLTVNEDAKPGTYRLPVGPYVITDLETGADIGFPPEFEFFGQWYSWIGNSDSLLYDRECDYGAGLSSMEDGRTEYLDNIAYVEITIVDGEGGGETPPDVPDEPMALELDTDSGKTYLPGETVTINVNVKNNDGIDAASLASDITFDPNALKLISVTTPIADAALEEGTDFSAANTPADSQDKIGTTSTQTVFFEGAGSTAEDGTILTLTFEVLPTAAGETTTVTYAARELEAAALDATVVLAANHTHVFENVVVPATCTTAGYTDSVCSCGFIFRIADEVALGHTASTDPADTVVVPAACDTPDRTVTKCSVCGNTAISKTGTALGHDLETVKSEVTCTTDGYEMQKCKRTGCKYETEKTNVVPMLGHKNPDGSDAWYIDQDKGFASEVYETYGEDVYVRPTTNSKGFRGKTCSICKSEWLYEEIPMLERNPGDVNMDGKLNLMDVQVLLKNIAKWPDLYYSNENSEVTGDGRVNMLDAARILQKIAKWDVDFDIPNDQIK